MRLVIDLAIAVILAAAVGISSAWYAIERSRIFGAVTVNEWTAWPREGSAEADPYSIARLARTGEVPLGPSEGLTFTAETDADAELLSGHCTYDVSGQTPPARLWTLTAYDAGGRLMANVAHRSGFHSREIIRQPDGSFLIAVSPTVQPGNWLPVAPVEHFELMLRLYDTPLAAGSQIADLTMPAIRKVGCS